MNADGTRSLVKEGEAFASLQGETYTSSPLLPKPEIKINYINEDVIVTLVEEDVPEGLDATDINIMRPPALLPRMTHPSARFPMYPLNVPPLMVA